MSNTHLLYTYLTKPREAIRYILDNPPHIFILALFLIAMLNSHLSGGYSQVMNSSAASLYLSLGLLLKVAVTFFGLMIIAAIIHFISDLFGCGGSVSGLFMAFLFSFVPYLFLSPVLFFPKTVSLLFSFACFVWVVLLQVKSIQEVYRLSSLKALVIFLSPFVFLLIMLPMFLLAIFLFSFALGLTMIPAA